MHSLPTDPLTELVTDCCTCLIARSVSQAAFVRGTLLKISFLICEQPRVFIRFPYVINSTIARFKHVSHSADTGIDRPLFALSRPGQSVASREESFAARVGKNTGAFLRRCQGFNF